MTAIEILKYAPLIWLDADGVGTQMPYAYDGEAPCTRMSWKEIDEFRKKLETNT